MCKMRTRTHAYTCTHTLTANVDIYLHGSVSNKSMKQNAAP